MKKERDKFEGGRDKAAKACVLPQFPLRLDKTLAVASRKGAFGVVKQCLTRFQRPLKSLTYPLYRLQDATK